MKNLVLSLKEIFIMILIQYITIFIIFCTNKNIILANIIILIEELIYIITKIRNIKFNNDNYFPYIIFGISICIIYNMIIFLLGHKNNITTDINIILSIISTGLIGPIFEELLFRYSFINKLNKYNYNSVIIIFISSVIFSILHTNLINMIYALIIGIINSYLYIKKKNISIPIVIHISINILSIFLTNFNIYILSLGIILSIISLVIFRIKKV